LDESEVESDEDSMSNGKKSYLFVFERCIEILGNGREKKKKKKKSKKFDLDELEVESDEDSMSNG
jgi:hypothetical protein